MNLAGSRSDVLVIGGGPGGAAAAAALAHAGVDVLLCEAGVLPRHRLCGEFVSPEAAVDLAALGLDLGAVAGVPIRAARVSSGGATATAWLRGTAYGVSRAVLDAWLIQAARAAGAAIRTRTIVDAISGDSETGFEARFAPDGTLHRTRAIIGAFGAQPRALRPAARVAGSDRVALKSHWIGAALPARVELHSFAGGYVGIAPVGRDRANVCVVTRADRVRQAGGGDDDTARGVLARVVAGVPAFAALHAAAREDPAARCGASALRFGIVRPAWRDILLVGDAASQPHPLAGDGIAMALRGGRLAAAFALEFLHGAIPAAALAARYGRAWKQEFAPRLRWDAPLHAVLERPSVATPVVRVLGRWPYGFETLIERTRGASAAGSRFDTTR